MSTKTQHEIPADLVDCYLLQKQALRCFRNDADQVAVSRRTIAHVERIAALTARVAKLEHALDTIAGFAPGNGDVCEIIARRARAALAPEAE